MSMTNDFPASGKKPEIFSGELYRIYATEKNVIAFSRRRIPFQIELAPADCQAQLMDFREKLVAAVKRLSVEKDEVLAASYHVDPPGFFDLENVLFYNFGASIFRPLAGGGVIFADFPAKEAFGLRRQYHLPEDFCHLYCYRSLRPEPRAGARGGVTLARWEELPIFPAQGTIPVLRYWRWVKENLPRLYLAEGSWEADTAVSLELRAPETAYVNAAEQVKPMLDGIICAFHGALPEMDTASFSRRLDCPEEWLENSGTALLGKRVYLRPWAKSFQWNPADHLCREVSFLVRYGGYQWTLSGNIRAVPSPGR